MAVINSIRACLDDYLVNTPSVPAIAHSNVPYSPVNGTSFIKVTFAPTSRLPAVRGLSPQQRYQGTYNLLICTPENMGSGAGYDIADMLLSRFDATTDISFGGIITSIESAQVGASYLDSPFYCTPLSVAWYHYNT